MEKLIDQIDVRENIITIDATGAIPNITTIPIPVYFSSKLRRHTSMAI